MEIFAAIVVGVASGLALVGAGVLYLSATKFFPSYMNEKGKNVATKEDIEGLTRQVESVKAEIGRTSFEHETRYARLHDRRAGAIADVYGALYEAEAAVLALTNLAEGGGEPSKAELYANAQQKIGAFTGFERVALFLPADVLPILRELRFDMIKYSVGFKHAYEQATSTDGARSKADGRMWWLDVSVRSKDITIVRGVLERAFRRELGEDVLPVSAEPKQLTPSSDDGNKST